jgi:hypothetical protein
MIHSGVNSRVKRNLGRPTVQDAALDSISQVIHDTDLKDVKDDKYQRHETGGIAAMIDGIAALHADDERRIDEGSRLLDATYAAFKRGKKR